MPPITASLLYALVECPHRVWLDAFEDPAKRDPTSPFVELLWERGSKFERETIERLDVPFLDLSGLSPAEKERETLAAMQRDEALIYSGRISSGDLLGQPDLLKREGTAYVAGDIKLDRGDRDSAKKAMDRCVWYLKHHVSVMVFPEGTRAVDGELGKFKDGAFRLAIEAQVPILPLAVHGTKEALRKHDWRFGRANAAVQVMEPVSTEGLTLEDVDSLKERVRDLISDQLDVMEQDPTLSN